MLKNNLVLLACFILTASSVAHDVLPCGTPPRPAADRRVEQVRLERRRRQHQRRKLQTESYKELCDQCIEIDVHVHLVLAELDGGFGPFIPHPLNSSSFDELNESLIDELQDLEFSTQQDIFELVEATINVANESFQRTPFRFRWVPENTKTATNVEWNNYAYDYLLEITNTLGSDDRRIMDVYLVWKLRSAETDDLGALGLAILPSLENERFPYAGVWMRYDVLKGGGLPRYETGHTLTHEAGHWLGLEHTFASDLDNNNTCNQGDNNDFLDDTPQQAGPSQLFYKDCTDYFNDTLEELDTCPDLPGKDLIFNYMNYVNDDLCWAERGTFTPNQVERMYRHFLLYRDFTTVCEDLNEMEIEIIFVWDENQFTQNWIRLIEEDSGFVVWNSNTDSGGEFAFLLHESSMIDLCVPKTSTYVLDVYDSFGDGFTNGVITVYRDGVLLETLEGLFDRSTQVRIERLVTMTPTGTPTFVPTTVPSQAPTTSQPTEVPTSTPTQPTSKDVLLPTSDATFRAGLGQRMILLGAIFLVVLDHYVA